MDVSMGTSMDIHVWIADLDCTMDISMDISTSFNLNCLGYIGAIFTEIIQI